MLIVAIAAAVFVFGWLLGRANGRAIGYLDGYNEGYAQARDDWRPKK